MSENTYVYGGVHNKKTTWPGSKSTKEQETDERPVPNERRKRDQERRHDQRGDERTIYKKVRGAKGD